MFDIQNHASFVVAILVFQLIPGPGTLAILNATARDGIAAGLGAVVGTLVGDMLYMIAAVLGLAAVMHTYPLVFNFFQWFGAAYLGWMGLRLLTKPLTDDERQTPRRQHGWVYFRQALAVSLTNPKVFFVAFFPLFLRADASAITLAAMMAHVTVLSFAYQLGLVLIGNFIARQLATFPFARKLATRLAGTALIGFGVKLALDNR